MTKKYNHMYDIAFALDTDVEDPFKVPERELMIGLLRRICTLLGEGETHGTLGFCVGESIDHCDSYENEDIAILVEDPPEYDTFDGKYHGAESQKGKED